MTQVITIGIVMLIALVDVLFLMLGLQTISEFLYISSKSFPVVAFAVGFVMGHVFWPVQVKGK